MHEKRKTSRALVATIGLALLVLPVSAQQAPRADSGAARRDYKDLNELLAHLPSVAPPAFDEQRALWLGSLPLACLDRMHSAPGRGGGNRGGAPAPDTTGGRGAVGDSAGRGGQRPAVTGGRATLSGTDYFWVTTYQLIPDHKRTRAFWGCTDWHSAVSSMWVATRLVRDHPNFGLRELAREKLNDHMGASNFAGELAFFRGPAGSFERPYGYAWLLKLQSELRTWPDSQAKRWSANAAPLAAWMADSIAAHINALRQPVRTGTQANTAFILTLALDYAKPEVHPGLRAAIMQAARRFYLNDKNCDTQAEAAANVGRAGGAGRAGRGGADSVSGGRAGGAAPADSINRAGGPGRGAAANAPAGGNDILSPCLSEAAFMARVLPAATFLTWFDNFLPPLQSARFGPLLETPGAAATGNERARFSSLALQRAYALEHIAHALPATDARVAVLRRLSAIQAERGLQLLRAETTGTHWLPAFALLYLTTRP